MKLNDFLIETKEQLESALNDTFKESKSASLKQAIHYSLLGGGKRLRPALVRAAAIVSGSNDKEWITAAIALEMVHVYSLIHDDLPAMDNDDLRRGKPTNHKAFNEATAILAGDALLSEAFSLIALDNSLTDSQARQMTVTLTNAAGHNGMVGGQILDLQAEDRQATLEELESIHQLKTGALIQAALTMGALSANADQPPLLSALSLYGTALGLAFQITDDILDVTSSTEVLGKTQGSDVKAQKSTYVSLLNLQGAKRKAEEQHRKATAALENIGLGTDAILWQLADYVLQRDH